MLRFRQVFSKMKCNVIGMIHVGALPGSPCYEGSVQKLVDDACEEAERYKACELDGVLLENMHDIPYLRPKDMEPEITATMTKISVHVRRLLPHSVPCGIQILAGGNKEAVAVAHAAGLQFIWAEGFVFSHIADEGFIDSTAGDLLRYRRKIGADDLLIFTDIKKKHSAHSITADVSLEETVKAAEFFLSDGVILTGTSTGDPVNVSQFHAARKCANGPLLIGSGVTRENLHKYAEADALIVGTYFKKNGCWKNEVDIHTVKMFMEEVHKGGE
ncbi:uncharacterized protein F13E9.13, mitochondrial isoform X1 [Anabrus simplex]|uniref:uncharacterized protein F13E9.13, mitochondrial isoform X1 n=1 Tax=Anabrus simplex TaxID=316456 RepID=UPI0035A38196